MSKLAKCVCGLYIICSSTLVVMTMVQSDFLNNLQINTSASSDQLKNSSKEEVELLSNEAQEDSDSHQHQHKKYGQVVKVDSSLSIRKSPDLNSSLYYGLHQGSTFVILNKEGEWYNIKHDNTVGYVHEDYVEEYDDNPPHEVYEPSLSTLSAKNRKQISRGNNSNKAIKAELTAYCNCSSCSESWGSKTAMQTHTRLGVIAAPPNVPLGSKFYIPELQSYKSDGMFDVEDRGGAIKVKSDGTYIIDVFLPTHEQVKAFGRKKTLIYLVQ